ncbi:MAG TPA: glycosyltransferase [Ferruginibacter sp.]|nr:glycosyltransferase [Ferruginibacter sp.]HRO17449.1 glycosyltransferase [Ferruginibacter sp.]
MKKFTIIIPVKNGGSYFKTCVQSVLSQTIDQYHLHILAHDCTDDTLDWLDGLSDKRIVIDYKENVDGILGNWHRIQSIPKNEFMTILGYDDLLLPHYLETMNRLIEQHPYASLYQAHFDYINAQGKKVRGCQPMEPSLKVDAFLNGQLTQTLDSMGTGYMMRSADYNRLGGIPMHYPNLIFADYELWMRLCGMSYLAVTPETCFQYRLHQSVSRVTNGEDYQQAYFLYLRFLQSYMQTNEAVRRVFHINGMKYMEYFCESLSHRILKTPVSRRRINVKQFIEHCRELATALLPDQPFHADKKWRVRLAVWFDMNGLFRLAFKIVQQMTLLFNR